jgi:hypothetical protein
MAPHGHGGGEARASADALLRHALVNGPQALSAREKMILLEDARLLKSLHGLVTGSEAAAASWRAPDAQGAPSASRRKPALSGADQPLPDAA